MTDVVEAFRILSGLVRELDQRSRELAETNKALEPAQWAYQNFIDAHELATYRAATQSAAKVPSADLRQKEALEAMPADVLGSYHELTAKRDRLRERCKQIEALVDGWRSIASYEKTMLEAG